LKARRPGDWHVHTMLNVKGGVPIIGPGKWVTVTGSMSSFVNPITTLTGETVDLENYNLSNTYFWHGLWYGIGILWVAYWARKPMFVPRLIAVDAGKADTLITATDRKVALGFAVGVIGIVAMSMASTNEKLPITTPLQAGLLRGIKSIDMPVPTVAVKIDLIPRNKPACKGVVIGNFSLVLAIDIATIPITPTANPNATFLSAVVINVSALPASTAIKRGTNIGLRAQ